MTSLHPRALRNWLLAGLTIWLTASCNIQRPQAITRKVATFNHTNVSSCSTCHSSDQPTVTVGQPVSFNHAQNAGQQDCATCHFTPAQTPGGWKTAQFPHNPRPAACSTCHSSQRPTSTSGWVETSWNAFNYTTHGGAEDCSTCHSATQQFTQAANWRGGNYTHPSTLTSCSTCHSSDQWPSQTTGFTDANGNTGVSFNHVTQASGDCAGCHQAALQNVSQASPNYSWVATGVTVPNTLAAITSPDPATTDATVTSSTPVWSGTSITSASSRGITVPQTMNHNSIELPPGTLQNCALCHDGASSGQYRPGFYHSNITTQPTTCATCHGSGTLYSTGASTNGMPTGFVGSVGANRTPATPEMNHFATSWSKSGSTWTRGSSALVSQDCSVCHKNPGGDWSGGTYHTALAALGTSTQPGSCLDCHANNRPSGLVPSSPAAATPTKFDHVNGMGDCASCHTPPTTLIGGWNTGVFHASAGTQASCSSCHSGQRPTNTLNWAGLNSNAPFDYSTHGGSLDCATCHSGTSSFTSMSGWSGGFYTHSTSTTTTCSSCHTAPTVSWYPNAGSITYNHAGVGDCIGCHAQALTNVIVQGASASNQAWVNSGTGGMPTGLVGGDSLTTTVWTLNSSATPITSYRQVNSISSSSVTLPFYLLHTSSAIPSFHYDASNQLKCADCHDSTSVSNRYQGGVFHTNPATTNLWPTQPTVCKDCHQASMPTGIAGTTLKHLDHAATLSGGSSVVQAASDCSTCHTQVGVQGGWKTGAFHGKVAGTPSTCSTCHYQEVQSIISTVTNHMNHSSSEVSQDCASCHAQPTNAQIAAGGYPTATLWSGGAFHSKVSSQPGTCNDCHSSERPSSTTQSLVDSTSATLQYMSHSASYASQDCSTCHTSELSSLAVGTSPTAWSRTVSFHTGVSSGVTSCKECHGLSNGSSTAGTGNTIPASVTTTTSASTIGNSGATITPYFSAPATGSPVYDLMSHTDGNVTSRDCISCHSTPAARAGSAYSVWQNAHFHSNVPSVDTSSGKCANCHYNIMPNASFTRYNHTTLVSGSGTITLPGGSKLTTDCSSCHARNIGVNWTGASVVHTANFLQTASCVACHTSGGSTTYTGDVTSGTAIGMPTSVVSCTDTSGVLSNCILGTPGTVLRNTNSSSRLPTAYTISFNHVSPASIAGSQGTVTIRNAYNLSGTACIYCHSTAATTVEVPSNSTQDIKTAPAAGTTGWGSGIMGLRSGTTTTYYNHFIGVTTGYIYTSGSGISGGTGGATIKTCSACHENARPVSHEAGRDCSSCHSSDITQGKWMPH